MCIFDAVSTIHGGLGHRFFGEEKMRKFIFQLVTLVTGMPSSKQRLGLELSQWLTPVLSVVTPVAPNKSVCVIKCTLHRASYNVQCTLHSHWSHWWPHTPQLTLPHASSRCQEDKRKFVKTVDKDDGGIWKWFQIVPLPNLSLNLVTPIGTSPRKSLLLYVLITLSLFIMLELKLCSKQCWGQLEEREERERGNDDVR